MTYRLSLLDKSPVAEGETAGQALARTLELAQRAEAWGYHRFWVAEHHNTSRLASPSPEIIIAWLAAQTQRIRLGSGGVMLQHYSPYKVAENFHLLASLAPGRIDLGVGKAPGGLPLSTRALQKGIRPEEKGDFAAQLAELTGWLTERGGDEDDFHALRATPLPSHKPQRFLLGASPESAALAAKLGWHFVFAGHLNGDKALLGDVVRLWRQRARGDFLLAVQAVVAESREEAETLSQVVQLWLVELQNGQKVTVASEAQAEAFIRQAGSPAARITPRTPSLLKGTATDVRAALEALHQQFGIEEFVIDTPFADGAARLRSLALLAAPEKELA